MVALLAVLGSFTGATLANAQTNMLAPRATIATARLEGRLPEILTLRALGAPVQLADGSFEQRYAVVANVSFVIVVASANESNNGASNGDDTHVIEGGVESRTSAYVGAAGIHSEIRVRSTALTPPIVTLEPRPAAAR